MLPIATQTIIMQKPQIVITTTIKQISVTEHDSISNKTEALKLIKRHSTKINTDSATTINKSDPPLADPPVETYMSGTKATVMGIAGGATVLAILFNLIRLSDKNKIKE